MCVSIRMRVCVSTYEFRFYALNVIGTRVIDNEYNIAISSCDALTWSTLSYINVCDGNNNDYDYD